MRLPDEQEERGSGAAVMGSIAVVSVLILIILAVVFMSNSPKKNSGRKNLQAEASPTPAEETVEFAEGAGDIESLYRENKLRSEDLGFWDLYEDRFPGTEVVAPTEEPEGEPPLMSPRRRSWQATESIFSSPTGTELRNGLKSARRFPCMITILPE